MIKTGYQGCLEYTLHAFKTKKGTFTLIGSSQEYDEFKNLDKCTYHKFTRQQIKEWVDNNLITPITISTTINWYENINK